MMTGPEKASSNCLLMFKRQSPKALKIGGEDGMAGVDGDLKSLALAGPPDLYIGELATGEPP
jgi:hypothetical protein|uniref:Uncharacterized protein n=1 Tax=Picea glauca TaxID=3330 RepID=A0A101LXK4_PICGL|nr:hypothetical protein ABT39_MTgene6208 [Picea glauca]QHR88729.1 hypothetical protein Q903MT_gene2743 [Picea sitchensis]